MKRIVVTVALLLLCWGHAPKSYAFLEIRSNFISSFLLSSTSDLMFRSHNGIYLGGSIMSMGVIYLYEPLHDYVVDTGYGVAMRFGDKGYLELSGGYFERNYLGSKGKGFFAAIIPGFNLSDNFGISIPIIAKKIESGSLDKRTIVDVVPYISVMVRL